MQVLISVTSERSFDMVESRLENLLSISKVSSVGVSFNIIAWLPHIFVPIATVNRIGRRGEKSICLSQFVH